MEMGTPKARMEGGRSFSFSSDVASVAIKDEYASVSGKSEGKYGNSTCRRMKV